MSSSKMQTFWIRLRSSVILMAITIASLAVGGPLLWGVLTAVSLTGLWELYKVFDLNGTALAITGLAGSLLYYILLLVNGRGELLAILLLAGFLALLAVYVFTFPKYKADRLAQAVFGVVYVTVMISYIYRIRLTGDGAYLVWLVFIASWGSDTMAYCSGMLLGRHKLAPVLSPKKSVEGAVGGVIGAAALGALFGAIFREHITVFANPVMSIALLGAAGSIVSQIGDLAASAIKRNYDIKDYGTLIPGHGGILDRFDSVIITAPIVYYLIELQTMI